MEKIIPKKEQLDFLEWEMGAFFHFGIRTFYEGHLDWDGKIMDLAAFNPTDLDCDSWVKTVKDSGLDYAILVCKHHDGFANWPSKYSDYSVAHTPWKDGKGDVVREFVDACHKYDIKIGLYYSPAEADFKKIDPKEYDNYFINQIGELLGNYGKIDYLWFDGNGSEGHEYDQDRIIAAIRGLQPNILIFNMWDPDTRWVGNEEGVADFDNSNLVSALDFSTLTDEKDDLDSLKFLPAECDFKMREKNWFYSEYDVNTVKSLDELIGLYYHSVGNGANFLVNIGPDRRGHLPEVDRDRLLEFGEEIRKRFSNPLPSKLERTDKGLMIELEEQSFINHVILSEDLREGESVEAFTIYVKTHDWSSAYSVHKGVTIGHKRIITFPTVKASQVIIEIDKHSGNYKLKDAELHNIKMV